jgi:hypothetical protein
VREKLFLEAEELGLGVPLERQRVQSSALVAAALAVGAPEVLETVEIAGGRVAGGRGERRPSVLMEEAELLAAPAGVGAVVHEPARTARTKLLFVLLFAFVFPSLKFTIHALSGLFRYVEDDQWLFGCVAPSACSRPAPQRRSALRGSTGPGLPAPPERGSEPLCLCPGAGRRPLP